MDKLSSRSINNVEAVNLLLIGLCSVLIPSILFSVWDGIIVFIILFLILRLFFKNYNRVLFTYSYGLLTLMATIFLIMLNAVNGKPFLAGGDDLFFYNAGKELFLANYDINTEIDGVPLWVANYPVYLYMISGYFGFLTFLGIDTLHFYHLTLFKVALGSIIPVLIFNIFEKSTKSLSRVELLLIVIFPATLLQTVSFLRDSVISLFFVAGVFALVQTEYRYLKVFWLISISVAIYFIRPVHSLFFVLFCTTYLLFLNKNYFWLKTFGFGSLLSLILVVVSWKFGDLFSEIDRVQGMYMELSADTSQSGSLGVKLYGANTPLLFPLKLLYYYLSPIPPPIVGGMNSLSWFLSLGAFLWYLVVFGFLKSVSRLINRRNPIWASTFVLFIVAGIVGISTSKDPRHLAFMYPIMLPFGLKELATIPKVQLYVFFLTIAVSGILGYVFFKFLL